MPRSTLRRSDIAWRGFVTHDGEVIAWPMLLADHNDFHDIWRTTDASFSGRWRQWTEGGKIDFDPGASQEAKDAVARWLEPAGVRITEASPGDLLLVEDEYGNAAKWLILTGDELDYARSLGYDTGNVASCVAIRRRGRWSSVRDEDGLPKYLERVTDNLFQDRADFVRIAGN